MSKPDFIFENELWNLGFRNVIGIDEVGRGSLAGPVVAGACVLKSIPDRQSYSDPGSEFMRMGIDDSKRLSRGRREALIPFIEQYFYTAIGIASTNEINRIGISKATGLAMKRAIRKMEFVFSGFDVKRSFFLVDGYAVKGFPGGKIRQQAIIKGDQKSVSIAASSVVAKVFRDNLMTELSGKYPLYFWNFNKGYGTLKHREALKTYGACPFHRTLFVDNLL